MSYKAPLNDMLFNLKHLANIDQVAQIPGFEDAGFETAQAVLEECARFNEGVLSPLNWEGDKNPSSLKDGVVTTSPGFKQAFRQYVEGGWQGLQHPTDFGGQGLPKTIGAACGEMLNSANMSFALCPLLSDGAIEALLTAGSDELKAVYLEKLVSGQWTGTMNLTEPQAGSDLAMVRSRADRQADGSYKVFGTKIFITYGEHDMAENIVHLVLARISGAPEGVKGISLFVVPKFLVNDDGSLGARNDVHCVSIEHKLGIKASPTAVLQYGDHGGAVGYVVGEENRGLEYMFIMMNSARYATGGEGKTTLSAHLAARCANAGTSTLLIDADMRRASLGRLLDVPPGPGLGDVLGGDIDLDEALITVQAGGFHFLSAGTPGRDPSRVLKSARLSDLISRLRQTYDLVIIDTPPVLPVADALILGRWADGAVMAARFDASRLPLVERANRQLALAGIPILGVVVNGVKGQDASYGNYAYSYNYYSGRSQQPPGTPSA